MLSLNPPGLNRRPLPPWRGKSLDSDLLLDADRVLDSRVISTIASWSKPEPCHEDASSDASGT